MPFTSALHGLLAVFLFLFGVLLSLRLLLLVLFHFGFIQATQSFLDVPLPFLHLDPQHIFHLLLDVVIKITKLVGVLARLNVQYQCP